MRMQSRTNRHSTALMIAVVVGLMVALGASAFGQGAYKVGDRVETMSAGKWIEVKIVEVQDNGRYYVVHNAVTDISFGASAANIRSIKANGPTNNPNNPNNQTQNPPNVTPPTKGGGTAATPPRSSLFERYGSRDMRTCAGQRAPAKGAITAALAKKYFICKAEFISSNLLYLVENVTSVQVGGGVPYRAIRGQYSFDQVDVKYPVYPIRGSYLGYQCKDLLREHAGPPDTNCNTYNNPKATGYCYKTTFGDWSCAMVDPAQMNIDNRRSGVAPPK